MSEPRIWRDEDDNVYLARDKPDSGGCEHAVLMTAGTGRPYLLWRGHRQGDRCEPLLAAELRRGLETDDLRR